MFGFGSPAKAPDREENRADDEKKKVSRGRRSGRTPPDSPDSRSIESSGTNTMENAQQFGADAVSSSWTGGRSTDADDSHSDDISSSSDSDDSHSRERSDSSSRSHNSSDDDSLADSGSDSPHSPSISNSASSMKSPDSSMQSSSIISPESSTKSPEASSESSEINHGKQSSTNISAGKDDHNLLVPLSGSDNHQEEETTMLSPSNMLQPEKDGQSGDDASDENRMKPTQTTASTGSSKQRFSSSQEKLTQEESLSNKIKSMALASISESILDEYDGDNNGAGSVAHSQVFSGEEADDEMTQISAGGNSTSLRENAALSIETSSEVVGAFGGVRKSPCELSSHMGVEPNPTSSTLHSESTQPRGMVTRKVKRKEKEAKSESLAQPSRSIEEDSVHEIGLAMEKARGEYEKGSESTRRSNQYASPEVSHEVQTPSFLNRNEIFHKTASDAVAALLTPRFANTRKVADGNSDMCTSPNAGSNGGKDTTATKNLPSSAGPSSPNHGSMSAFQPPRHDEVCGTSHNGGARDIHELIDSKTEKKLESLEKHMLDPTKTLTDLLTAIATPDDKSKVDLAYMVRRKNACGAIKVMTQDPTKRDELCWTVGVLPALTSVLVNSFDEEGAIAKSGDKRIQHEYEAALSRAIDALVNFSIPKENRIVVFHTPGLIQAILHLIKETQGSASKGCTAILAYLAKSAENRLIMVQIPGLFDALVPILRPRPPRVESSVTNVAKRERLWVAAHDEDKDPNDSISESPSKRSERNASVASEDSQKTLKMSASQSPIELFGYDETAGPVLRTTRQHVFAFIGHLCKEKENAYLLAREAELLRMLVQIAGFHDSPTHVLAVQVLAHLSRHRHNARLLVFQERGAVPALVRAAASEVDAARLHACRALQNLAQDKSCRQELAGTEGLVRALCRRGRYARAEAERLAAVAAIKNLCDEPANLIPMTNTPECVATLMHLAHGREEGVTEAMQHRACDALATLSHWLRKIATSGRALDAPPPAGGEAPPEPELFVPTLRVVTWDQWQ